MAKLNFQHCYSSLQCHMILQKSEERACVVQTQVLWGKSVYNKYFRGTV